MTTPDTTPEAVERLAANFDIMAVIGIVPNDHCAAKTAATLRALAAENAALREQVEAGRLANGHEKRLRLEVIALHQAAEAENATMRAEVERLRGALDIIDSISVHSGGEIHGVTASHWREAFQSAQSMARAALDASK
jgi:hypothetical protein